MNEADERIRVGRVSGVYGVKGWVRVFSETAPRAAITEFPQLWMQHGSDWRLVDVEGGRGHGQGVVMKFREAADRDGAHRLIGAELAIERAWLPPAEDGAYYWADLLGMAVENNDGAVLGTISGFIETGANDVLVVQGDRERLIPWVRDQYVLDVDLEARRVRVDWDPEF
ncbi:MULTISPECIES: ribosome maturation factor RimM [Thioalkalivibrio]|uniref:ribosome maturation factor RimM n=1 Tax=Thioalkalivibrio TaxID=106633 RepID=UPI0003740A7B|nr:MULTISPECIES: ribosome maturation factor RimM [Thioalkalivibrio]OOC50070.1 16S rRNA processing protein RimM [Thioalkalivibrio versutus]